MQKVQQICFVIQAPFTWKADPPVMETQHVGNLFVFIALANEFVFVVDEA